MSNNKKIIGVIISLVVLLAIAIPFGTGKIKIAGKNLSDIAQNILQKGDDNTSSESIDSEVDGENSEHQHTDDGDSNSNSSSESNPGSSSNNSSSSNGSSIGIITDFDNTDEKVLSNYKASDADIIIQRVDSYSGLYIEDGSDEEISNVAAIQLKNTSDKDIEFAQIQLYNGNKKLVFDISALPANSSAVVMEKNKTSFNSGSGVTYGGTTASLVNSLAKDSKIKCEKVDDHGIKVTNTSEKDIPCVRIFYKYKTEGYYIGGITYTAKIEKLKAGESQTIYPSHFDSEGGQIMMVKTYTTTD